MSTTIEKPKPLAKKLKLNTYPFYSPRFWHGMCLGDWLQLLERGHFRIHPLRWFMAFLITLCAIVNSIGAWLQRLIYGRRIAATEINNPPVFIIGHWRSGTTYLHELMVLRPTVCVSHVLRMLRTEPCAGERLDCPHVAVAAAAAETADGQHGNRDGIGRRKMNSRWWQWARRRRTTGWRFRTNRRWITNSSTWLAAIRPIWQRWRRKMREFVQMLTLRKKGKRLVMKSPPHTGRIEELAQLFPGAKFIHIVRDPYVIFPSTRRLWVSLDSAQGLQHPHYRQLGRVCVLSASSECIVASIASGPRFRPIKCAS